jgi:hypothetical protein
MLSFVALRSLRPTKATQQLDLDSLSSLRYKPRHMPRCRRVELRGDLFIAGKCVMRLVTGWLLAFACGAPLAAAEQSFPLKAQVARNHAPVRSAASEAAYATDSLAAGVEVEVFSQEPNGWCAIRPPAGSFSWAPARFLKTTADEKLAEVIDDGVVAWIGSRVAGVSQPHWQVRLKKGEIVEVFGANRLVSAEGGVLETWCKIAPPAGEFRWIHVEDLAAARTSPRETPSGEAVRSALAPQRSPGVLDALEKELDESSQPPAAWRLSAMIEQAATQIQNGSSAAERGKARLLLERLEAMNAKLDAIQARNQTAATTPIAAAKLEASPVQQATFVSPAKETPAATGIATSSTAIPSTSATLSSSATAMAMATPPIAAETQSVLVASSSPAAETRYDAQGWLMPVLLRRSELPPFAITDAQGKILEYVSPAPGLNLHRYLKQEVGVFGHRSEGERLGTPHLTVQRVVVLDRHR